MWQVDLPSFLLVNTVWATSHAKTIYTLYDAQRPWPACQLHSWSGSLLVSQSLDLRENQQEQLPDREEVQAGESLVGLLSVRYHFFWSTKYWIFFCHQYVFIACSILLLNVYSFSRFWYWLSEQANKVRNSSFLSIYTRFKSIKTLTNNHWQKACFWDLLPFQQYYSSSELHALFWS